MCNSQKSEINIEKLLGLLGFAARAGKLIYGTPMICEALKKEKKIYYVFRAAETSENTRKRIEDKCKYYGVRLVDLPLSKEELAKRFGKLSDIAAVALVDKGFAEGIEKLVE